MIAYVLAGTNRIVNLERVVGSARQTAAEERMAGLGIHVAGAPVSAEAPGPPLEGATLAAALTGRWSNPRLHLDLEIRPDGAFITPDGTERWEIVGPGRIRLADEMVDVALTGDVLFLRGPDGSAMKLHRT